MTNSTIISTRYGKNYEKIDPALRLGFRVFLLPEPALTVGEIIRKLSLYLTNPGNMNVAVCLNLSLANERVIRGKISELSASDENGLKVIFISPSVN